MFRVLSVLVGVWCICSFADTSTNQELLKNLSARMEKLPSKEGSLIKSFSNHSQSYIYDQALAIIAFAKAKEKDRARLLLLGLKSLQMKDGSLYFSYYMGGLSPYPIEGDKRFAGAIAWVALAASHYQRAFDSKEFVPFNAKILSYLHSQKTSLRIRGDKFHAVKFAPHDVKASPWNEANTVALEHNLDAFAAFRHFANLNKTKKWNQDIKDLQHFIMSMWDSSRSHFWSGANVKTGAINKEELYLDNQSWSLLALPTDVLKEISPKLALELNCEVFYVEHENIKGFMDSKPTRRPATYQFVWSEGTLGQILAMKKIGMSCDNYSADQFLASMHKMKKEDGGIAYATSSSNPDFTTASSVAGTAWLYFAANDINPFELN